VRFSRGGIGAADEGMPVGPARLLEGPAIRVDQAHVCCWDTGERSLAVVANQGESLVVLQPFKGPGEVVHYTGRQVVLDSVAVSRDGRWLAAGGPSGIKVWERATARAVKDLPGTRPGLAGRGWPLRDQGVGAGHLPER
jgi:hypothetical protein